MVKEVVTLTGNASSPWIKVGGKRGDPNDNEIGGGNILVMAYSPTYDGTVKIQVTQNPHASPEEPMDVHSFTSSAPEPKIVELYECHVRAYRDDGTASPENTTTVTFSNG